MTVIDLSGLPERFFRLIYVDFPWQHESWSAKGEKKSRRKHYPCIATKDAYDWPLKKTLADPAGCIWAMWARDDMLDQAIDLGRAWGLAYKTKADWVKLSESGDRPHFGLGRHFRNGCESLLIWRTGALTPYRRGPGTRSLRSVIAAPVREHSRKPDEWRRHLEARYRGPYLEMFGRETAPGWFSWGNETTKFDNQESAT